jgi:hypothetical protein
MQPFDNKPRVVQMAAIHQAMTCYFKSNMWLWRRNYLRPELGIIRNYIWR